MLVLKHEKKFSKIELALITSVALVFAGSCTQSQRSDISRLALVPGNILVDDASLDWARVAIPVILQHDLMTGRHVIAFPAGGDSVAYQQQASEIIEATVERYASHYVVHTVRRDLGTQAVTPLATVEGPADGGIIGLLDKVAREIDGSAGTFPKSSSGVISSFASALQLPQWEQRLTALKEVLQTDPAFGPAQIAAIGTAAGAGSPETAVLIRAAAPYRDKFDAVDRAAFDATAGRLLHAPLQQQIRAAETFAEMAPNNLEALSLLGTDLFLQNDAAAGERPLLRALGLTNGNSAIRLQLANGYIETRQFDKAGNLLSKERDPASVTAYAIAELLSGNKDNATEATSNVYRAQATALANLDEAEWLAGTNGYRAGIDRLQRSAWATPDQKAIALAQTAIWQMALGDRPAAQTTVQEALPLASSNVSRAFTEAALALTQAGSATQLKAELQNTSDGIDKRVLLAYGLFFYGDYDDAANEWRALLDESGDTNESSRAMLAASLAHLNRRPDFPVQPFVPDLSGNDPFATVAFTEMRKLLTAR